MNKDTDVVPGPGLTKAIQLEDCAWTIAEMSLAYHLGRTTLYAEIAAGRLEVVKVGRSTRVLPQQRRTWENKLPTTRRSV